jgi:hypothetical protein
MWGRSQGTVADWPRTGRAARHPPASRRSGIDVVGGRPIMAGSRG